MFTKTSTPDWLADLTPEELEAEAQYQALLLAEDLWADIDLTPPF